MAEVVVSLESILALQKKLNISVPRKTIFNLFLLLSNRKKSVQGVSNLSSNINDNDRIGCNPDRAEDDMFSADFPSPSPSLKEFRFDDLKKCTREFSADLLLGKGGFGEVFLGWVDETTLAPSIHGDGIAVAVKRLSPESYLGYAEWLREVNILGKMDHPNIIRLLGYCRDGHEHLLVYEYMPNKDLYRLLHRDDIMEPLSWKTRLFIMIGVVRGLIYLHSRNIILLGLTSSNILMDENFSPRLGGFGLAKYEFETWETHNTSIKGTMGYLDPDYYNTGQLTMMTDIYSFGVVLLESITGRKALDASQPGEEMDLATWATQIESQRRTVKEIMDPRLEHDYPLRGASECFALALRCVVKILKDRPSSEEVLQSLEQIYNAM